MTNQEIYDKVAIHLFTQWEKSLGSIGCAYRGDDGKKCAASILIPDEDYDLSMEGKSVKRDDVRKVLLKVGFTYEQIHGLIYDLQNVHDNNEVNKWEESLIEVARDYKLSGDLVVTMASHRSKNQDHVFPTTCPLCVQEHQSETPPSDPSTPSAPAQELGVGG